MWVNIGGQVGALKSGHTGDRPIPREWPGKTIHKTIFIEDSVLFLDKLNKTSEPSLKRMHVHKIEWQSVIYLNIEYKIIFSIFFARHDFGPINISFEKYFSKQYLNIDFTILLQWNKKDDYGKWR